MDELKQLIDTRPIIAFRTPPGFNQHADAEDEAVLVADAMEAEESDADTVAGMTLGITYRDAAGHESQRTIECRRVIESADGTMILAHCHLRDAPRAFPVARIEAITDYRTGQTSGESVEFFQTLGVGESVTPTAALIARTKASVRMLVHCAAADGEFATSELDVILDYVLDAGKRAPKITGYSVSHLTAWINALRPTSAQLQRDVEKVAGDPDEVRRLGEAMSRLIMADGDLADEEIEATRKLLDAVKGAAG